jgi:hypothetical protein
MVWRKMVMLAVNSTAKMIPAIAPATLLGEDLIPAPWEVLARVHLLRERGSVQGAIEVRHHEVWRIICGPLPKRRHVHVEELAHAALSALDLAVHLVRRRVEEPRADISEERLEPQTARLLVAKARCAVILGHATTLHHGAQKREPFSTS